MDFQSSCNEKIDKMDRTIDKNRRETIEALAETRRATYESIQELHSRQDDTEKKSEERLQFEIANLREFNTTEYL